MIRALPPLLLIALDVFCLIDVITSRDDEVRHLPKIAWFLLILIVPVIGSFVWLFAGRPQARLAGRSAHERPATAFPEYDRPGRAAGLTPESDAEFLSKIRDRAEEQRRRAAEQKAAAQEAARREQDEKDPGGNDA
ncbi:MAG: hypothetical protein JWQ74_983 [Marmoricola sp.]|nr:hypothetical protein [Marmoricola sp.]